MLPEVFEILENRLGPSLSNVETVGRPMIPVRTQLLSTIWLLSTPDSFRSVSEKFDLGKSSLNDCVRRVVKLLYSIANEIIVWPTGQNLITSKEKFMSIGQTPIPGIVGAIDGTFIFIKKSDIEGQLGTTEFFAIQIYIEKFVEIPLFFFLMENLLLAIKPILF
ncbi:uncharacterized protein LOC114945728 [Nylanderia fulva]|uniref:uncharacterized protein LOC114945728 n=1 Tax=Nylanderia fulva TaxID=613905 RepID=UPI0010FB3AF4|nr:uncharacterized protein LOC114945728 [Nylanderia fulva]